MIVRSVEKTSKKKSIKVNTIFNVLYKLLNLLFPLVTSVYLARVLGPTYIGKVSYAQSIVSYFVIFASLGIPTYGMREIAKYSDNNKRKNTIFSELFILNLISTLLSSAIYTCFIICISDLNIDIKLFLCVGLSLYLNVFNIDWFYSGQEEYVYITLRSLVVKILSVVAILALVKSQDDYIVFALITSFATTGNYIWNVINLKNRVKFEIHDLNIKTHIKPVLILLMTMLATDLYNQIDITMLGLLRTDEEVGYYSNGIRLVRMVNSVTTAISATILPRMCLYFKEKNEKEYKSLFWKIFDIVIMLAIPCVVGIILVAKPLIIVLFGKEFIPTVSVIQMLSPIVLIVSVSYLIGSVVLTSTNKEKYLLRATIGGAIVNILLNVVLIPFWGTIGATLASLAGETIVLAIHFRYGKNYVHKKLDLIFLRDIVISTIVMAVAIIMLQNIIGNVFLKLVISVIVGVSIYFIMLVIQHNKMIGIFLNLLESKLKRNR